MSNPFRSTIRDEGLARWEGGPPGGESALYLILSAMADEYDRYDTLAAAEETTGNVNTFSNARVETLYRLRSHRKSDAWKALRTRWSSHCLKEPAFISAETRSFIG